MSIRILSVALDFEQDIVSMRQRARQIADLLGFESQDQVRIATAASEIARNAFRYAGGGKAEFLLEGVTAPQILLIRVTDHGPGIPHLQTVLGGQYRSSTGLGVGIIGARRLMDQFEIRSAEGKGTEVVLKKVLPAQGQYFGPKELAKVGEMLAASHPETPLQEIQQQNRELLRTLEELRERQEDLVRLNRELGDTNRGVVALYAELDDKAAHLRSADEMKSRFLSNMSHEFRTPLNSIRALGRLLLDRADGPLSSAQEKQVQFVCKAAEDLAELVDDVLDIAKIEAGKIDIRPTKFSVADLFSTLRGMLRPLLVSDAVQLRFDEPTGVPALFTDEAKVSQILRNFISNSLKFTERGEVRVSATVTAEGDRVIFAVTDTGIGIAPEDQRLIFEEFTQVHGPLQRTVKGTGLGLPLCRKLAELLGGTTTLQSEPGVGTTFCATLPVVYADVADSEPSAVIETPYCARLRVLIVEHDEQTQLVYENMLRDSAFEYRAARTLTQALDALARARPAVIILDPVLLGDAGWQWLGQLKSDPVTRTIPVVITSTSADEAKAYALGADAYLLKPLERAPVISQLDALTRRRILVIDDDPAARYMLRKLLEPAGYQVLEAPDGASGLRTVQNTHPQLIVLDLGLPDIAGHDILTRLREDPATHDIPVVIATSHDLTAGDRATLVERAQAVLSKRDWENEILPNVAAILNVGAVEVRT